LRSSARLLPANTVDMNLPLRLWREAARRRRRACAINRRHRLDFELQLTSPQTNTDDSAL
jgi:hypothetical protein